MQNISPIMSPFLKLVKIGIVTRDIGSVSKLFSSLGTMSFEPGPIPHWTETPVFRGKPCTPKEDTINVTLGDIEIELVQPIEGESPGMEFLKKRGEGINHISFAVNHLEDELFSLTRQGFNVLFSGRWEDGSAAYFDTGVVGVTLGLIEGYVAQKNEVPISMSSAFSHLDHIGIVVNDANLVIQCLTSLGIGPFKQYSHPPPIQASFRGEPYTGKVKGFGAKIGDLYLNIHQPVAGKSYFKEFLHNRGEGFDHICFLVDDVDKEVTRLTRLGLNVLFSLKLKGFAFALFDTGIHGFFIEVVRGFVD
jgi:methylmalonyl-CoA/ethylmalonyl-CoA epimerase